MKANRIIHEASIFYTETTYGNMIHVKAQHMPSGLIGKATTRSGRIKARYDARAALQVKLDAYWLP